METLVFILEINVTSFTLGANVLIKKRNELVNITKKSLHPPLTAQMKTSFFIFLPIDIYSTGGTSRILP